MAAYPWRLHGAHRWRAVDRWGRRARTGMAQLCLAYCPGGSGYLADPAAKRYQRPDAQVGKRLIAISFLTLIAGVSTMRFIKEPRRDPKNPRSTVLNNLKLVVTSANLRIVAIAFFAIQISLSIVQPILPLFIVSLQNKTQCMPFATEEDHWFSAPRKF